MSVAGAAKPDLLRIAAIFTLVGPLFGYVVFFASVLGMLGLVGAIPLLFISKGVVAIGMYLAGGPPAIVTAAVAIALARKTRRSTTYVLGVVAVGAASTAAMAFLVVGGHGTSPIMVAAGAASALICSMMTLSVSGRSTRLADELPSRVKRLRAGDVLLVVVGVACALLVALLLKGPG